MFRCSSTSSCRFSSDKSSHTKSKTLRHNCNCNIIRQQQRQQTSVSSSVLIVVYAIFMLTTLSRNINTSNAFILLPKQATISSSVAKSALSLNCPTGWFTKLYQSTKKTTESVLPVIDTMDTIPNIPPLSKTAKRVYWIRHGEVINPGAGQNKSVFYGSMDVPLSSFGQEEAIAAGKFLSQQDIVGPLSNVYSSNLTRAIYGAEQVRIRQHQAQDETSSAPSEVIQVPGFMELNRGEWCGKTIEEIGKEQMDKFNACDESVTPVDGESYRTFNDRVLQARNNIVLRQLEFGQCAAVVSHLQVTRCIVADALQKPLNEVSKISIATASITCIDYEYSDVMKGDSIELPKAQTIHFQSYKPDTGLRKSMDGAN